MSRINSAAPEGVLEFRRDSSTHSRPTRLPEKAVEWMTETEGTVTTDITVTISGWDAFMLTRIAEHQGVAVGNIASVALNTGLHQYADVFDIPRPRIRRAHHAERGGA